MRERTDHSLLLATARGDETAFAQLVARHRPRLVRYATSRCGRDAGLAEDAVQDGLVRAHRAIVAGKVPVDIEAWLFAIVRNRCHDYFRAAKPTAPLPPELPGGAPSAFEVVEQGERLAGALERGRAPAARPAHRARGPRARGPQLRGARAPPGDDGARGQVAAAPRPGDPGPPGLAAGLPHAARGPRGARAPGPDRDGHGRRARDRRRGDRDHRAGGHERPRVAARSVAARRADGRAVAGGARRGCATSRGLPRRRRAAKHSHAGCSTQDAEYAHCDLPDPAARSPRGPSSSTPAGEYGP